MIISHMDWAIVGLVFALTLAIGLWSSRRSGKNFTEYFLAGGRMPWWLLGISMVATTFSADTPNLVADIVRRNGISGNWVWWAFLLTGMLTVFVYARLWKRSGVLTDLEFYELRYSGGGAHFLRGFRALYLGVVFNVVIMATVMLAAIKIGGVMLGVSPVQTVLIAGSVTLVYTLFGGLRGVILTDFFLFIIAMTGSIGAAVVVSNLPEVGGIAPLFAHEAVAGKLRFLPDFNDTNALIPLLIIPLAVQWWSSWYPGAEPGGGGYVAQRMLSARNERHATAATLLFNVAHYALRPWPWIIVALASLVVYPDLESLRQAFPNVPDNFLRDDLAYPAMLTLLPKGLLGIVIASLIAAFMSTISTHLNWGASYIANDFYRRFIKPGAGDRELVAVGRLSTLGLMALSALFALLLESALDAFNIILQIGAGTGLIYILRWFWWRINAFSEIAGMVISLGVALFFQFAPDSLGLAGLEDWQKLLWGVAITTAGWLTVTFLTRPTDERVLEAFYRKIRPAAAGWRPVTKKTGVLPSGSLTASIGAMATATVMVYAVLFGTGYFIYGAVLNGLAAVVVALISGLALRQFWPRLGMDNRKTAT